MYLMSGFSTLVWTKNFGLYCRTIRRVSPCWYSVPLEKVSPRDTGEGLADGIACQSTAAEIVNHYLAAQGKSRLPWSPDP